MYFPFLCSCTCHATCYTFMWHVANWQAVEVACGKLLLLNLTFSLQQAWAAALHWVGGHGSIAGQSFPFGEYLEASHSITDYLSWVHWHLPKRNFWMQMYSDWIWYQSGAGMLGLTVCIYIIVWESAVDLGYLIPLYLCTRCPFASKRTKGCV